mgnify:FL=1|tara:strand:+ start:706 stop:933 length:228 start_codon:yes stop_codon:yes gene_type:complete
MKVHRTTDEMVLLIEQHKKEIWEWKQKESNWINTQNLADGYKKVIEDLSSKLVAKDNIIEKLEQEIERLVAEKKK